MISVSKNLGISSDRENLERKLTEIVENLKDMGRKHHLLAKVSRRVRNGLELSVDEGRENILEPYLVKSVEKDPLSCRTVVGVDGGSLCKSLHGLDIALFRAVATIFFYEEGALREAEYYPSEMPSPKLMSVEEPLDSRELYSLVEMRRQLAELKRAKEAADAWDVDAVLLDGSIAPQYVGRASSSRVSKLYEELIDAFRDLYRTATKNGTLLLSAVKDSRSARFVKIFQKKILPKLMRDLNLLPEELSILRDSKGVLLNSRDTAFLNYLLEPGERSSMFRYAEAPANLLEKLGNWKERIFAFYLKSVPYDYPLRVEFVGHESDSEIVNQVAGLVYALSAHHDACALPSVLIEADACARLQVEEISILKDNITDRLKPFSLLDLRRERRPFQDEI